MLQLFIILRGQHMFLFPAVLAPTYCTPVPPFCLHCCSQELCLRITVSNSAPEYNEDDYLCPLYVRPSRVTFASAPGQLSATAVDAAEEMDDDMLLTGRGRSLLTVALPSMENIEECACRNIVLCSST